MPLSEGITHPLDSYLNGLPWKETAEPFIYSAECKPALPMPDQLPTLGEIYGDEVLRRFADDDDATFFDLKTKRIDPLTIDMLQVMAERERELALDRDIKFIDALRSAGAKITVNEWAPRDTIFVALGSDFQRAMDRINQRNRDALEDWTANAMARFPIYTGRHNAFGTHLS